MKRVVGALIASVAVASSALQADERQPRVVFNDDAQMLMETPAEGATEFVKQWLDKEAAAVPFSTYVFLAATPDVCTYESKTGETFADRLGPDYPHSWAPGIRALRAEGTDVLKVVAEHMRTKGKEVLAAIRMNDTHHRIIGHNHPLAPQFAIDHPEFVIKHPDGRTNETALDYSYSGGARASARHHARNRRGLRRRWIGVELCPLGKALSSRSRPRESPDHDRVCWSDPQDAHRRG